MEASEKIFFLHIRKTAGTSVRSILEKRFEPAQRCPIRSELELKLKISDPSDWKQYLTAFHFVGGHYYRVAPLLIESGFKVVTMLRDPLERGISAYNHIKNDRRDPLHKIAAGLSFREALMEPKLAIEFRNPQARYLVGNAGFAFDRLTREDKIAAALAFLQRIDFFGFIELKKSTGRSLARFLGLSSAVGIPFLNSKITENGITRGEIQDDIAAFETRNTIDREIHCRALEIYDERFT